MKAFLLLSLCLSSCVYYDHEAVSSTGNREKDRIVSLGGTSSQKGADGSSFTHDHQASFQAGMQTVGTYGTGLLANSVLKAKEITAQGLNAGNTRVALGAQNAAVSQTRIAAQQATTTGAIGAGATLKPITVNAP